MKAGTRFINTTHVWLREKSRENGTEFVVADEPKSGKKPVEVDVTTALAWQQQGWIGLARATDKPKA